MGNPKTYQNLNKVRLSNKIVLDKVNECNRLKRRISTAGTSKRFPKDFFKIETNEEKDVVVEIERATRKKPFLGGYKHKKNGVEYHHASAQTMQKTRPPPNVERFCR